MIKTLLKKFWKDILLIIMLLIIAIGVYEKINSSDIINDLNSSLVQLELDKARLTERFESVRGDLSEARSRIAEYKVIERELRDRINQLEETVDSIEEYSGAIGDSERRASEYNREAQDIVRKLREGVLSNN